MSCNTVNLYDNLEFCPGESTLPGITPEIYGCSKRHLTSFPKLPELTAASATMESIATLEGDFKCAADSGFHKISVLTAESGISVESQGSYPNISFKSTLTAMHPGTGPAASGYCRLLASDDMVFVVRDRSGKFRVIGSEIDNTTVTPKQDLGKSPTDSCGTTIEISATDRAPAPFYTGKLPLLGGSVIDCSTGEITAS